MLRASSAVDASCGRSYTTQTSIYYVSIPRDTIHNTPSKDHLVTNLLFFSTGQIIIQCSLYGINSYLKLFLYRTMWTTRYMSIIITTGKISFHSHLSGTLLNGLEHITSTSTQPQLIMQINNDNKKTMPELFPLWITSCTGHEEFPTKSQMGAEEKTTKQQEWVWDTCSCNFLIFSGPA